MKHAVILDIDGTLLESAEVDDRLYRYAIRQVLGEVSLRGSLADYTHVTDTGILRQILADNGLARSAATIADVQDAFITALGEHIRSSGPFARFPGARRFVAALQKSERLEVAIATGGWRRSALLKLESAGIDASTLPLKTSDDAHERTDIMRAALESLPGPFTSIVYYGDGVWDQAACRLLGWRFSPVGTPLGGIANFHGEFERLLANLEPEND